MDKRALERFATTSRVELIEKVKQKAKYYGFSQDDITPLREVGDSYFAGDIMLNKIEVKACRSLRSHINYINTDDNYERAFRNVIEEVAYTWFNRLVALRFMEVHKYLPTRVRVTSSIDGGADPDILREALSIDLDVDRDYVYSLKQNNKRDELYRYMIIKQCDNLQEILPFLFDKTHDFVELLFPDNLLADGGIISNMVNAMPEGDCDKVEIIGWLYQYYISDRKNEVFAGLKKNKKIQKEDIAPATQLFTPEWIVRYMVQNSLGRLWIEHLRAEQENSGLTLPMTLPMTLGTDNSGKIEKIKSNWKYYLEEAPQEEDVEKQLIEIRKDSKNLKLENIKILDPSMGSGHILVYAFDLLYEIYEEQGYMQNEISKSIIENNLYGLDIDYRAAQLAYFAIMMKGRSKDSRFFSRDVKPNVYAIEQSNGLEYFEEKVEELGFAEEAIYTINYLISAFMDAKEFGSLVEVKDMNYDELEKQITDLCKKGFDDLVIESWFKSMIERIPSLIDLAKVLSAKYDIVCTNPPYMGSKGMNAQLSEYVKENYPDSKSDLFAVFIELCKDMTTTNGFYSLIVQHSYMFLSSYEKLRRQLLLNDIINMAHLGARAFAEIGGEVVQSTTFTMQKRDVKEYNGTYIRLVDYANAQLKEDKFLEKADIHYAKKNNFTKIPGMPIAYWVSEKMIKVFENKALSYYGEARQGFATGKNDVFLRLWYEVDLNIIGLCMKSRSEAEKSEKKWFPCNKGGSYNKWYGNNIFVADWQNDGSNMKSFKGSVIRNISYYFRRGLTWSTISSSQLSMRYSPTGTLFETKGSVYFLKDESRLNYSIGFLNSKIVNKLMLVLSPTLDFHEGPLSKLPMIIVDSFVELVEKKANENIMFSKSDWDSFETSWEFEKHPLLSYKTMSGWEDKPLSGRIKQAFKNWQRYKEFEFSKLKENEEELNRIFIDIYDLADELTPEVEDKNVTINRIVDDKSKYDRSNYLLDRSDVIKSFISYAVGCMMGRYSPYKEGLLYAGGEYNHGKICDELATLDLDSDSTIMKGLYKPFMPDEDNVIPITDDNYFSDDIVGRFVDFVEVCYGDEHLDENIEFIADSLKPKNEETPKETIRRYFLNDFFKDHIKRYKKRPIYWLFTSGKQKAFNALIYMHRYDKSTLARIRTDYLHRQQSILEAKKSRLVEAHKTESNSREQLKLNKEIATIDKQLDEMAAYDEILHHEADRMIEIDLDDGVVVNYAKFDGLVGKV